MTNISRRSIALVASALLTATSVAACGSSSSGSTSGSSSTSGSGGSANAAGGTLRIAVDLTYPPYDTRTGDKPSGLDVELMDAVSAAMGMKPVYNDTRFAQLIPSLQSGQADVIASTLYVSADRAKVVDFVPYLDTGNAILTKKDSAGYKNASELCGKAVGVLTGTVVAKHLTTDESAKCKAAGKPAISVKTFPTDPEATQALLSGQVDAQLTDAAVAKSAAEKSNGRVKVTSSALIYPVTAGIAVKKGNTDLLKKLNTAMDSLKSSGKLGEILKKYGVNAVDQKVYQDSLKA